MKKVTSADFSSSPSRKIAVGNTASSAPAIAPTGPKSAMPAAASSVHAPVPITAWTKRTIAGLSPNTE